MKDVDPARIAKARRVAADMPCEDGSSSILAIRHLTEDGPKTRGASRQLCNADHKMFDTFTAIGHTLR
jgi:hypothetical protein